MNFYKDNKLGVGEDEALIIDEDSNNVEKCFPEYNLENKRYGWCQTQGNFYNFKDPEKEYDERDDWGYCSKECYLNEEENKLNNLRLKKDLMVFIFGIRCCMKLFYSRFSPVLIAGLF